MRPEHYQGVATQITTRPGDDHSATAAAAAAAEAARIAAQPLDPQTRAVEGFRIASGTTPPSAGPEAMAVADAAANARTALLRSDLPTDQAQQVRKVIEHLGNAVIDGKIDPHINNTFRQHLYDLATKPADSSDFKGALAQMNRAAEVLDRVQLAGGTRLGYDAGHAQPTRTGLPVLDIADIDADLYFKTADGTLHIESTKHGANTLADELWDSRRPDKPQSQIGRQTDWRNHGTTDAPRAAGYYMLDKNADFTGLLDKRNLDQLERAVGDPKARNIVIGDRAYSVAELRQISADGIAKAQPEMPAFRAQWEASHPGQEFRPIEYYRAHMGTPEQAMAALGKTYGEPLPPLRSLPQPELPSVRQGAGVGALAGGAVSIISLAVNGELSVSKTGEVLKHSAAGALAGAATSQGERLLTPVIDRSVGPTVQRAATGIATRVGGTAAADAAGTGLAVRTLATRAAGSTAVGVVISAGVSAYENRNGLARGDSKAIGNVVADTAVGAGSVAASVAAGAAVGSIVPGAGTAVGAVVGLAVGVGVAYGAQISGMRDAISNTVSGWADKVKGWF